MIKLSPQMRGSLWMATAFLTCPCHLAVTVPILLGLTAGTAIGAFLSNNLWLIGAISTIYFLTALALGFNTLRHNRQQHALAAIGTRAPDEDEQFACCMLNEAPRTKVVTVNASRDK